MPVRLAKMAGISDDTVAILGDSLADAQDVATKMPKSWASRGIRPSIHWTLLSDSMADALDVPVSVDAHVGAAARP